MLVVLEDEFDIEKGWNLLLFFFFIWFWSTFNYLVFIVGRAFTDKVDRLKLAEIVKQAIEVKTHLQDCQ